MKLFYKIISFTFLYLTAYQPIQAFPIDWKELLFLLNKHSIIFSDIITKAEKKDGEYIIQFKNGTKFIKRTDSFQIIRKNIHNQKQIAREVIDRTITLQVFANNTGYIDIQLKKTEENSTAIRKLVILSNHKYVELYKCGNQLNTRTHYANGLILKTQNGVLEQITHSKHQTKIANNIQYDIQQKNGTLTREILYKNGIVVEYTNHNRPNYQGTYIVYKYPSKQVFKNTFINNFRYFPNGFYCDKDLNWYYNHSFNSEEKLQESHCFPNENRNEVHEIHIFPYDSVRVILRNLARTQQQDLKLDKLKQLVITEKTDI